MKITDLDKNTRRVTLDVSIEDFVDMKSCVQYLVSTLSEQDTVAMNFPGDIGKARLEGLSKELSQTVMEISRLTVPD